MAETAFVMVAQRASVSCLFPVPFPYSVIPFPYSVIPFPYSVIPFPYSVIPFRCFALLEHGCVCLSQDSSLECVRPQHRTDRISRDRGLGCDGQLAVP